MTTTADFIAALRAEAKTGRTWWSHAAVMSLGLGWWHPIMAHRDQGRLYLARFWLDDPAPSADPEQRWESGRSNMLHFILEPDDDPAMHDHPWQFSSRILSGGYSEEGPLDWTLRPSDAEGGQPLGARIEKRSQGATIMHGATDLHRIVAVQPGTVSMVTTGPRTRDWGFMPPGKAWVAHKEYLAQGGT